jgi:small subunit ribosomal protein S9
MTATKTETKYTEAIGRRKTSTARVRMTPSAKGSFTVNDKDVKEYFPTEELLTTVNDSILASKTETKYDITVKVMGGGSHSQAEAVRHGIARLLVQFDETSKTKVKNAGFLKRDPRAKERRKFGLKKARKAPQWSKR